MACVSLAEKCADILFAVRNDIESAGDEVIVTLKGPVHKLTECVIPCYIRALLSMLQFRAFQQVEQTMIKQCQKPFLKRYLQRDADLRRISLCNQTLQDAVSVFSVSTY